MLKLVRWLVAIVVILLLAVGALRVIASFSDGPLEIFAGGAFRSGSLHEGPFPDWAHLKDRQTVEFQSLVPERSRTTWIMVHDNRLFIPSGYMTTTWGKIWKQWPLEAEKDPRILLRVDDVIYPAQLRRITAGPELQPVLAELGRKYVGQPVPDEAVESGYLWLFEVVAR